MDNFLHQQNTRAQKTITLILILSLILLTGCSIFKKNSGQQPQQEEQAEKIPKQLESIETSIENIFIALDGPSVGTKELDKQKQGQEQKDQSGQQEQKQQSESNNQQKSGDKQAQGQEQGKEGGKQGQDQGQSQQKQEDTKAQEQKQDPWQKVTEEIKALHSSWNEYMPEVTKKGARKDLIDGFSTALNDLTKIAENKDKMKTLLADSKVHKYISDFYSLYKTKISPELKRVIYYTRNSVLNAMSEDWTKAASDMEELKTTWSFTKNTIDKEQQEDATKLDLSVYELEKVIKEKNKSLVEIKGKLALSNTESLQKLMEKGGK